MLSGNVATSPVIRPGPNVPTSCLLTRRGAARPACGTKGPSAVDVSGARWEHEPQRVTKAEESPTQVKDVMTTVVYSVGPGATIDDALRTLTARGITSLPVLDDDRVVGNVSEADLLRGELSQDPRAHQLRAQSGLSGPTANGGECNDCGAVRHARRRRRQ